MDELLSDFLVESMENISLLDNELLILEKDPNNKEILKSIFRILHTIKGTCGFIGLSRLEKVAHAGETVLVKLRDEKILATPQIITLILECIDAVKYILNIITEQETEPDGDDSNLINRLNEAAQHEQIEINLSQSHLTDNSSTESDLDTELTESEKSPPAMTDLLNEFVVEKEFSFDEIPINNKSNQEVGILENNFQTHPEELATDEEIFDFYAKQALQKEQLSKETNRVIDGNEIGLNIEIFQADSVSVLSHDNVLFENRPLRPIEDIVQQNSIDTKNEKIENNLKPINLSENLLEEKKHKEKAQLSSNGENALATSNIRVSVKLLEDLMSQVSELVLTRNQIMQTFKKVENQEANACLRRLDQITSELHEGITKTRMQPISNAWVKLPRLVRDLAIETSKKVNLIMNGSETELDRQVIEMIKDPLTHMLRNSVDHGLETPEIRIQNGKSESGTIKLNAYHQGGMIIIEVSDDGKGLPVDKIKEKAIANGLTTTQLSDTLTESQIYQFIFKAGFSTAEAVTNVSGRGVGMDVVRSNIEKINGSIDVQSFLGKGTLFTIKIPLTLAIVSALLVEVKGLQFAIPQINVQELIKISGNTENYVDYVSGKPLLRLRDQLIPLVKLNNLLRLEGHEDQDYRINEDALYIIVIQVANNRIGIIVDKIYETQEIVVKPVSSLLRHISLYSGNTILGDGKIVMILDPNEIVNQMHNNLQKDEVLNSYLSETHSESKKQKEIYMILRIKADSPPMAIPLFEVTRVETIETTHIESIDEHPVMQYHGMLIPLVIMEESSVVSNKTMTPLLILNYNTQTIGFVVHSIDDIFENENDLTIPLNVPGKKGIIVLNGLATDIMDTAYYLKNASTMFKSDSETILIKNNHNSLNPQFFDSNGEGLDVN